MKKTLSEIVAEMLLASLPFLFELFKDLLTKKKQDNEEKPTQMDS